MGINSSFIEECNGFGGLDKLIKIRGYWWLKWCKFKRSSGCRESGRVG